MFDFPFVLGDCEMVNIYKRHLNKGFGEINVAMITRDRKFLKTNILCINFIS